MNTDDLLPKSSPQQDQERRSFKKLCAILPDNFIYREETGGDFGTDRWLEVQLPSGAVSNVRVPVQGKSARKLEPNDDGTYSCEIPIKSINYLRRHLSSFVFLYLEDQGKFKWAWIYDVYHALTRKERKKKKAANAPKKSRRKRRARSNQAKASRDPTFSYRFHHDLDSAAFKEIAETALRHGSLVLQLGTILSAHGSANSQAIVDFNKSEVTDVQELKTFLRQYGYVLASSGMTHRIDSIVRKLPGDIRDDPELQCVLAYSKLIQGDVAAALALVRSRPDGEPTERRQLRMLIHGTAENALGILKGEAFEAILRAAHDLDPKSLVAAHLELRAIRDQMIATRGRQLRDQLPGFEKAVRKITDHAGATEDVKISVELQLWEIQGQIVIQAQADEISTLDVRARIASGSIGIEPPRRSEIEAAGRRIGAMRENWLERGASLAERVSASNNWLLKAHLEIAQGIAFMQGVMSAETFATQSGIADVPSTASARALADALKATSGRMETIGCLDLGARALLLRADLLSYVSDAAEAKIAAECAQKLAREIGSRALEAQGRAFIEGCDDFSRFRQGLARLRAAGTADPLLDSTAAELDEIAASTVRMLRIPPERLSNVRRGLESHQIAARERRAWCKHLVLLEDNRHTQFEETMFAVDVNRKGHCTLLKHTSAIGNPDPGAVFAGFKSTFCDSCSSREPLGDRS